MNDHESTHDFVFLGKQYYRLCVTGMPFDGAGNALDNDPEYIKDWALAFLGKQYIGLYVIDMSFDDAR